MSIGKNNDHVFRNVCQTYVILYYYSIRVNGNKTPIPLNITRTDNCPTQYRCRQDFFHVTTSSSKNLQKPIYNHRIWQKYSFKGSWDTTGKIVKQQILLNELTYAWCYNYLKLTRDLTKDGQDKKTKISKIWKKWWHKSATKYNIYNVQNTYFLWHCRSSRVQQIERGCTIQTDRNNVPSYYGICTNTWSKGKKSWRVMDRIHIYSPLFLSAMMYWYFWWR